MNLHMIKTLENAEEVEKLRLKLEDQLELQKTFKTIIADIEWNMEELERRMSALTLASANMVDAVRQAKEQFDQGESVQLTYVFECEKVMRKLLEDQI